MTCAALSFTRGPEPNGFNIQQTLVSVPACAEPGILEG
jgi:hypothetical protein